MTLISSGVDHASIYMLEIDEDSQARDASCSTAERPLSRWSCRRTDEMRRPIVIHGSDSEPSLKKRVGAV